jgi:DNA ligase-associated metallophosphoesterase
MNIKIQNQDFELHSKGGIYWQKQSILLVADVHLGKSAHFRKNGSAIPSFTDVENYHSLDTMIQQYDVKGLVFLGDLFHSVYNSSWNAFADWVSRQKFDIDLVIGNHDVIPASYFEKIGIKTHLQLQIEGFSFTHHPQESPDVFNFCGHLHPGFRLRGNARQMLKLACFYQQEKQLILPAFGNFTGHYYITPTPNEKVFVIAEDAIFEV